MFYYRIDFSLILSILSLKHKNRPSSNTLNSMITLDLILAIYLKLSVDVRFSFISVAVPKLDLGKPVFVAEKSMEINHR
jgi:hypothetical protein